MQRRCDRNRKRSKRRAIYCPVHGCYLDSVSQKHSLYADQVEQLQQRGIGRRQAKLAIAEQSAVPLSNEWLEAFWCDHCQASRWYHIRKVEGTPTVYQLSDVPPNLWQQATGVIHSEGNPSVSEFTRQQARMLGFDGLKAFRFVS